jgi:hypothetical protein
MKSVYTRPDFRTYWQHRLPRLPRNVVLILDDDYSNLYNPFLLVFIEVLGDVCCLGFLILFKIISKYELIGLLILCYCSTEIAAVETIGFMVS